MDAFLIVLSSIHNNLVNSLVQSGCTSCCGEGNVPETYSIQPGCFDWSSFGVALLACIISIITCVFTVRMYHYVKKQLDTAEKQLKKQIETDKENEKGRKRVMDDTKGYVGQINLQILNNSLINLVEKRQRFLQDYDFLHGYLSQHSILLKEGPVIQKEISLRQTIDNIIVNLCLINDILALFDKKNDSLVLIYNTINCYIEKIKNEETIATDMDGIDNWLDEFKETEIAYSQEVEQAIEQIKNDIKLKRQ